MKKLLMGNEAIAIGAIRAGIGLASGYPGTPSTEILETLSKNLDGSFYIEWSVNEKVALEVAAGAAYTGVRSLVTMKMVGLNVAADPLMSLNYVGVKGGMVIVVADDPGPISSQTEQDTRHFGIFAKLAVFDPSSPEEAYLMIADAFEFSESLGRPVIMRVTTRICHGRASVEILPKLNFKADVGFEKSPRWVIFPKLTAQNKPIIENNLLNLSDEFSEYPFNFIEGSGRTGLACGSTCYAYVKEALKGISTDLKLFKVSTYPFPEKKALEFLKDVDKVLVIEELDPVIENCLINLCGRHKLGVKIFGKRTRHVQNVGEITPDIAQNTINRFLTGEHTDIEKSNTTDDISDNNTPPLPALPVRPPVMCAGCSHRASFLAVKEAAKGRKAVFCGDIGCYTLGNAAPLDMVDTCLCMGGGITVAQGICRGEQRSSDGGRLSFAFIGDSTFFHSGITGIINAVYNMTDIIAVILDNHTTAMTGGQQHPGMGETLMRTPAPKVDIYEIIKACGVSKAVRCNPFNFDEAKKAVASVLDEKGVRVILFEAPCVVVSKSSNKYTVDESCTGCGLCRRIGCPAMVSEDKKVYITYEACNGCGLCTQICRIGAIKGV
ncbi:MAG: indolepyruvate ferredoxin oxidoreductase subunit alpha [Oscillospiraceae bacterium]|nr:indolepyruvate ferredoxin oxidoreductase subunit alpha [Oscillospiraceae bacterium]